MDCRLHEEIELLFLCFPIASPVNLASRCTICCWLKQPDQGLFPERPCFSFLARRKEGLVVQSCLTLCDPMNRGLPGSSVHEILQARILQWVAISFSRGSSRLRDRTPVSCTAGWWFTVWTTREVFDSYDQIILQTVPLYILKNSMELPVASHPY